MPLLSAKDAGSRWAAGVRSCAAFTERAWAAHALAAIVVASTPGGIQAQERGELRGPIAMSSDGHVVASGAFEVVVDDPLGRTFLAQAREPMSIAVSGDGARVVVGDRGANRVLVFLRTDRGWREEAILSGPRARGGFGGAVALSDGGERLVVGAPGEHDGAGTAWVFTRSEHTWSIEGELALPDARASDGFGSSVAVDGDGTHVLVGAPWGHGGAGRAVVFARLSRLGRAWSSVLVLAPPRWAARARFGSAVAIREGHVLIGTPLADRGRGAVFCFDVVTEPLGARLVGMLRAEPSHRGLFGSQVALSRDGSIAVVAAPRDRERGVVRYRRIERGWAFLDRTASPSDYLAVDGEGNARGAGPQERPPPRLPASPRPLPEDALEVALGPLVGGNWTLDGRASNPAWFSQHTQIGAALELRRVFFRTLVLGVTTVLSYAVSDTGWRPPLAWFWSPPVILEQTRISIEPRVALRGEFARVRTTAIAMEVGTGPTVGWVLDDPGSDRLGVGAHLDARLVLSWARACVGFGVRGRVHGWTQEPLIAIDATLEAVLSFAVATPM